MRKSAIDFPPSTGTKTFAKIFWRRRAARILSLFEFSSYVGVMLSMESICEEEWQEWYRMRPQDRWLESERLWGTFLALGGSLDPEPDSQSPFNDAATWGALSSDGRPGVRSLRRSGI
jgi:hypothetical protein